MRNRVGWRPHLSLGDEEVAVQRAAQTVVAASSIAPSRRRHRCLVLVALAGIPFAARAGQMPLPVAPPAEVPVVAPLLNPRQPLERVLTGGFTTPDSFGVLLAQGYKTYIDLRSDPEILPGVAEAAAAAGIAYRRIPIGGEGDLDLSSARALDALLDDPSLYPLVVACGSGNRVGALFAAAAFWLDGVDGDAALELGQRAGLTRLEPSVRLLLGLPPLVPPPPPAPTVVPPPPG
jgi:protein tyrosine phosphatase (PTP) superfamily phosphohydrolase (DUF442 family)